MLLTTPRYIFVFLIWLISLSVFTQDNAEQIFQKASDNLLRTNMELSVEMNTTDKNGRVKIKALDVLKAKFGDVEKTRMYMQKPERAKGVTIVLTNLPEELGIIEVLTPANGKIRKMKATPENMALVGSDFSFTGYSSNNKQELSYELLGIEQIEGKSCYYIVVKDKNTTEGGKAELLIEQKSYHIVQIIVFDENDTQINISKLSDYQDVKGALGKVQPMHIISEDLKTKKQSTIQVLKITPRNDLKEEDFILESVNN